MLKLGINRIKEPQIEFALRAKFADGDPEKAYDFLVLLEDSIEGIVREYDLSIRPLGAVNREKVTCWLDALLFAMFARLDSFESILFTPFADEPRKRLAILLRLWVNLLRTGKLITTDIVSRERASMTLPPTSYFPAKERPVSRFRRSSSRRRWPTVAGPRRRSCISRT